MNISELIPVGSKNSISRSQLLTECKFYGIADNDRKMRKLIEDARAENCILNMQDGKGYFIPDKDDKDKLRHYINQEKDRYQSIAKNLKMAHALLEDMEHERLCCE